MAYTTLTKGECLDESCVKNHTTGTLRHNSRPLCQTSLKKGECFDEKCELFHQKGTKRVPPRKQHKSPNGEQTKPQAPLDQQHFLEEVLRSLRAEINTAVTSQIGSLRSEGSAMSCTCHASTSSCTQGVPRPAAAPTSSWPRVSQPQPCATRLNHHH